MFRFSIRELMLVTLVAAVCGAWWVDRRAQANGAAEWKYYATCLENLLTDSGFEVRRGKEWVQATRTMPCLGGPGDSTTVHAKGPYTNAPSEIDPEFDGPYPATASKSPPATR
jgi:hypothetical protein